MIVKLLRADSAAEVFVGLQKEELSLEVKIGGLGNLKYCRVDNDLLEAAVCGTGSSDACISGGSADISSDVSGDSLVWQLRMRLSLTSASHD